mmetsp:Transcript_39352/g.117751  ORF Transcript_39352/g.117751 Transcript_39352/m.117751 type:complete len:296 (-) Transcript_39352:1038-1925(-)
MRARDKGRCSRSPSKAEVDVRSPHGPSKQICLIRRHLAHQPLHLEGASLPQELGSPPTARGCGPRERDEEVGHVTLLPHHLWGRLLAPADVIGHGDNTSLNGGALHRHLEELLQYHGEVADAEGVGKNLISVFARVGKQHMAGILGMPWVMVVDQPRDAVREGIIEFLVPEVPPSIGNHDVLEVPRREGPCAVRPAELPRGTFKQRVMVDALLGEVPDHGSQGAAVHGRQEATEEVVAHGLHQVPPHDPSAREGPYEVREIDGVHPVHSLHHDVGCCVEKGAVGKEVLASLAIEE